MLVIDTTKLKKDKALTLSSKDELFEGTPFFDMEFTVSLVRLTRTESIDIMQNVVMSEKDINNISQGKLSEESFIACIENWDGFLNENKEPIPCSDEFKRAVWRHDEFQPFVNAVQQAIGRIAAQHEGVIKNIKKNSEPTLNGQTQESQPSVPTAKKAVTKRAKN